MNNYFELNVLKVKAEASSDNSISPMNNNDAELTNRQQTYHDIRLHQLAQMQ